MGVIGDGEHGAGEIEPGGAESLAEGSNVEVVRVDGNHLTVKPVQPETGVNNE